MTTPDAVRHPWGKAGSGRGGEGPAKSHKADLMPNVATSIHRLILLSVSFNRNESASPKHAGAMSTFRPVGATGPGGAGHQDERR